MRGYSPKFKEKVIKAVHEKGLTIKEASARYKVSTYSIRLWLKKEGLLSTLRTRKIVPKNIKEEIISKVNNGSTIISLAKEYDITVNTIYRWLREDNIKDYSLEFEYFKKILEYKNK